MRSEAEILEKIKMLDGIMEMVDSPDYLTYMNLTRSALQWVLGVKNEL